VTNGLGSFFGASAITFTVPVSPFGTYPVYGVGQTSQGSPLASFHLVPALSIVPTSGHASAPATVSGTGFGANEVVHVLFNCAANPCAGTPLGTAVANTAGSFSGLSVTIPATATLGGHTVGGIGATTGAVATTVLTVN
jgi:hypothetical protein